jgi:hypothetical protein
VVLPASALVLWSTPFLHWWWQSYTIIDHLSQNGKRGLLEIAHNLPAEADPMPPGCRMWEPGLLYKTTYDLKGT